jgi:Flp pilus assembly pilin Flp
MLIWTKEKLSQFRDRCDGVAAIEMALIFPVMIILYFGLVDVTNLLSANRRVTIAASTIADLVTQMATSMKKSDLSGFYKAVQPIMDPFPSTKVGIQISSYRIVGGSVKRIWHEESGPSCGAAPADLSKFNSLMTGGNDIVLTRVCVTMKPIVGKMVGFKPEYTLTEQFALRPRQSQTLDCAECKQG